MQSKFWKSVPAILLMSSAAGAWGAVFPATFDNDTVGLQPAGWFAGHGTSGLTITTVDDTAGIGTGKAMEINVGTTTRPVVATFSSQSLAVGDSLTLALDVRFPNNPPASNRGLRWGLFNDQGTTVTKNITTQNDTTTNDDFGYVVRVQTGTGAFTGSLDVTATTGISTAFAGYGGVATDTTAAITNTSADHITLTLTRVDTGMQLQGTSNGISTTSVIDTNATNFTFNEVGMFTPGIAMDFYVDNVSVTYNAGTAVPEPASLSLLALAAVPLLARRRKV